MNFFILGLPRSRTAWLANFMTYGVSFCYHEGIDGCRTVQAYADKLGSSKGDATTGAVLFDLDKHFPKAKKLIIEGDIDKAIEYAEDTYKLDNRDWLCYMKSRLDKAQGMRINFNDIDSNLQDIWEYLSDEPFNADRANVLLNMNIQKQNPYKFDLDAAASISHEFA